MEFSRRKNFWVVVVLVVPVLTYVSFNANSSGAIDLAAVFANQYESLIQTSFFHKTFSKNFVYTTSVKTPAPEEPPKPLANPPAIVKAVYVTGWSAGTKKYQEYLQSLFATTQINALVVDIKDSSGFVSYDMDNDTVKSAGAYHSQISDINALVRQLHSQNIYVIGRIVVFEDPVLPKTRPDLALYDTSKTQDSAHRVLWQDNKGLTWLDPASIEVSDYIISLAKDALAHGFDEINFDYVRFPSDGNSENMGFPAWDKKTPRHTVIKNFFQRLRGGLPGAKLSADIFGQTTVNTDDMGIGQIFEDSLPYFDYVCPMVYPSHYITGFLGFVNPAEHPYEIIKNAMDSALARKKVLATVNAAAGSAPAPTGAGAEPKLASIRPWLQNFNLGAIYDGPMVLKEIKAVEDATGEDFSGYLLWNPSNIYTKDAILKKVVVPK